MPAPDPTVTQASFIANWRRQVNALLDARAALKSLREQAVTLGYPAALVPGAFAGSNGDLQAADITNGFTGMDTLETGLTDFSRTPPAPTTTLAYLLKFRQ